MKIVLTGAGGQLAFDLVRRLQGHELVAVAHEELDIRGAPDVTAFVGSARPDLVINTAAYNLVDRAEAEPAEAFAHNAIGPLVLAKACQQAGCAMLHFSTDYVFGLDARRAEPWLETDAPGPLSVYGASKLAGEYFVRAYCDRHYVVRTAGLFGVKGSRGKGGNFVETMLRLAREKKPVRVVADQRLTPSYTTDVAEATRRLIETGAYGLYHLTSAGSCTWHEFAREIFRLAGLAIDCEPIATDEFPTPARRPAYSVLANQKLLGLGLDACPPWQDALARYLKVREGAKQS